MWCRCLESECPGSHPEEWNPLATAAPQAPLRTLWEREALRSARGTALQGPMPYVGVREALLARLQQQQVLVLAPSHSSSAQGVALQVSQYLAEVRCRFDGT